MEPAITIRPETATDIAAIAQVERAAFDRDDEARLVDALRSEGHLCLSLIAYRGSAAIGHIAMSPLEFQRIGEAKQPVVLWALAPLAVVPAEQGRGAGTRMVREALDASAIAGVDAIVVLGDPAYYGRFGFRAKTAALLDCVYAGPHLQAIELRPGALEDVRGGLLYARAFSDL